MVATINADTTNGVIITSDTSGEIELQANGVTKAKITANGLQDANGNSITGGMYRNLIINGDMKIAQRGTSASGLTSSGYHTVDRMEFQIGSMGTWTMTQDSDVPTGQGFGKSFKLACTTADASPAASDSLAVNYKMEGQDIQHLAYGTASAKSLTLSFWVKSNKTGTYINELVNTDVGKQISKSYIISSANTWEKKTMTFAGDTVSGFTNDNNLSMYLRFYFGAGTDLTSGTLNTLWATTVNANRAVGQVNLADSTSNYINITGVQLEVGSGASDFEFLPYDVQLARCQRYYYEPVNGYNHEINVGWYYNNTWMSSVIDLPVPMRAKPTMSIITGTNYYTIYRAGTSNGLSTLVLENTNANHTCLSIYNNTDASGTAGQAGILRATTASSKIQLSAEL